VTGQQRVRMIASILIVAGLAVGTTGEARKSGGLTSPIWFGTEMSIAPDQETLGEQVVSLSKGSVRLEVE